MAMYGHYITYLFLCKIRGDEDSEENFLFNREMREFYKNKENQRESPTT